MCNAHNHLTGCTCGWGGESLSKIDDKPFNALFGTLVRTPKKCKVHNDVTYSDRMFDKLFDINATKK